jgi:hypothetical protein
MSQLHRNDVRPVRSQRLRNSDPEFAVLAAMCRRLIHEKAALEECVEKLEAELADYARDEQARQLADREEAEFQMLAIAGDVAERAG